MLNLLTHCINLQVRQIGIIYIYSYVCFRGCNIGQWFLGCPAYQSGPGKDGFRIDVSMASQSSFSRSLLAPSRSISPVLGRTVSGSTFRWHLSHILLDLFLLLVEEKYKIQFTGTYCGINKALPLQHIFYIRGLIQASPRSANGITSISSPSKPFYGRSRRKRHNDLNT